MNDFATSRIGVGGPPLIAIEPSRAKCAATRAGSPLHQASV